MKSIKFITGRSIPQLGLGTWKLTGSQCRKNVREALAMGYTHIDTADAYGNHKEVGQGIKDSGISRDSFFLTTKIAKPKQKEQEVLSFGERMLKELQIDYVDLLLIHWPTMRTPFAETLGAMKQLVDKGFVRDIGISNFNAELTAQVAEMSEIPITTNQVEFHPLLFQKELMDICTDLGITVTAYSPLAQGEVMQNGTLKDIASSRKATPADISIAWLIAKGIITIPKASSNAHLESNLQAASMELTSQEIGAIDAINEQRRLIVADGWREFDF